MAEILSEHLLLLNLTTAVSTARDVDTALNTILQRICETTSCTAGDAWFYDRKINRMVFRTIYIREKSREALEKFAAVSRNMAFPKGSGLPGMAWERKTTVWLPSLSEADHFPRREVALESGLRSALGVPIPLNDEVIAVLCFYFTELKPEDKDFVNLTTALAGQLGKLLEQKETEEALRESELRFRSLIETSNDAIVIAGSNGRILETNRAADQMFGYRENELTGKYLTVLMPEKYRDAHLQGLTRYLTAREPKVIGKTVELEGLRKSGEVFPIDLSLSSWEAGGDIYFGGFIRDSSARRQNEENLKEKNTELQRSNEELEQFAYAASHDLQEPLRMVSSYTQLLYTRLKNSLGPEEREFMEFTMEGTQRMQALINDLLLYSRVTTRGEPLKPVNFNTVVEEAQSNLSLLIDETEAEISKGQLPTVLGDASQLVQLMQNLLGNSIKFRRKGVTPKINISVEDKGKNWLFHVADNGIGIPHEYRNRIFNIFQRLHTREEYAGTGIGLALCRKIVDRHGGRIWLEKADGEGAVFSFMLKKA